MADHHVIEQDGRSIVSLWSSCSHSFFALFFKQRLVTMKLPSSLFKHLYPSNTWSKRNVFAAAWVLGVLVPGYCAAQLPTGWKAHDIERDRPKVITPGESNLPHAAPSDAIVLFDGTSLERWRSENNSPAKWIIRDGVMESVPGSGYIFTEQSFGDVQLHLEWAAPAKVEGKGQGRGNSV
jgi:hypothetical protein